MLDANEFYKMIFEKHLDVVKKVIKSVIFSDNIADVEDCVQNVIVAALEKENLQEHPNVEGWLYVTGRNIALKFNKEYLKREKILDINKVNPVSEGFLDELIENDELKRLKERDVMKIILKSLSKTERLFFELRYIKKHDNAKICEITGKTDGAIRVRYSRLKEKIKNIVKNM